MYTWFFFFQAEDGIRDLVRSRGLGDVYKRQSLPFGSKGADGAISRKSSAALRPSLVTASMLSSRCLLYTSDAADERSSVDLGGRRIIKKTKIQDYKCTNNNTDTQMRIA